MSRFTIIDAYNRAKEPTCIKTSMDAVVDEPSGRTLKEFLHDETSAELIKRMQGTSENYDCYHDIIKTVSFEGGGELKKLNDYLDSLHSSDSSADIPRHIVCAHIFGSPVLVMNRVNAYNVDYWTQIAFGVSKNSEGKIELGYDILCRTHDKDNGWSAWTKVNGVDGKQKKFVKYSTFGDTSFNQYAGCKGLIFSNNLLPATGYLGFQNGTRYINSFSYFAGEHSGNDPQEGDFYLCIAKQIGTGPWIVQGCSTNTINIRSKAVGSELKWDFDNIPVTANEGNVGLVAVLSKNELIRGDELGGVSFWNTIRAKVATGKTQDLNKCICANNSAWNYTVQAAYKITFYSELPDLPSADGTYGVNISNGQLSWVKIN